MNMNPDKNRTTARVLDALDLFEADLSIARDQPAGAATREPIDGKANGENSPRKGEDHQA